MSETCPVCKTECSDGTTVCSVCGFKDELGINRTWVIKEDFSNWFETVVKPYRVRWKAENAIKRAEAEAARKVTEAQRRAETEVKAKEAEIIKLRQQVAKQTSAMASSSYENNQPKKMSTVTKVVLSITCIGILLLGYGIFIGNNKSLAPPVVHTNEAAQEPQSEQKAAVETSTTKTTSIPRQTSSESHLSKVKEEKAVVSSGKYTYDLPEFKAGLAAYEKKNWGEAIKHWLDVLKKEPGNPGVYYYMGICRFNMGELDNAAINFNKSFDFPERGLNANYYLGRIYEQKGDNAKAISFYNKYLQLTSSTDGKTEVKERIAKLSTEKQGISSAEQQVEIIAKSGSGVVKSSSSVNSGWVRIEDPLSELDGLCRKKSNEGYFCGVGMWTSNSKDMASQIAILRAKGDMASQIINNVNIVGNRSSIITNSISERITGVRHHFKSNEGSSTIKNSEICIITNVKGKVSLTKIRENSDIVEYYILVNGKIAGSCTYQRDEKQGMAESYTVKVDEGIPDIQTQKIHTEYNQEKKEYTAYVMVTLPKASVGSLIEGKVIDNLK